MWTIHALSTFVAIAVKADYPLCLQGAVMNCLLCRAEEMAERGRHHDYSHNGDHATYDTRGHDRKPRDMDKRGSAGDRRTKENRQRDMTTTPDVEPPAYRNHNHEGPSRL